MMPRLTVLCALLLGAPLQASAESLASWLDRSAIAELAETLTRHPRFHGERIDIGPLEAGQPAEHGSALSRWIEQHVFEALLDVPGIRLVSAQPTCPEDAPDVYLGIAIGELPGGRHRVALRFLDRAEGVWISGVGSAWEGYLTREQRDALGRADARPEPAPTLEQSRELAERFVRSLTCSLRRPGALPPPPWRIEPGDDGRLNALAAELGRRLPRFIVADDSATPLGFVLDARSGRLDLTSELTTLASITVDVPAADPLASPDPSGEVVATGDLDTAIDAAIAVDSIEPTGICRRTRAARCLAVRVSAPATVRSRLLLTYQRAGEHRIRAIDCRGGAAGERHLRIAIDRDIDAAPIGIYVLGTSDEALGRRIDALLAEGGCDRAADATWIARLGRLAERPELRWQRAEIDPTRLAVNTP